MFDVEDKSTARSSYSYAQSSSSGTPAPSAPSKTHNTSTKVTERQFTPWTRKLAIASKSHIRNRIVYHEAGPFKPLNSRISRMDFAWDTVKEVANNSNDSQIKDAFKRSLTDDKTKKDLLTFVSRLLNNQQ